jgi:hypothetical protein
VDRLTAKHRVVAGAACDAVGPALARQCVVVVAAKHNSAT